MVKGKKNPNDQRSDSMNPNNPAYQANLDNRSRQLNPEDEVFEKTRSKDKDDKKEEDE